jgi:hypothetical protein
MFFVLTSLVAVIVSLAVALVYGHYDLVQLLVDWLTS